MGWAGASAAAAWAPRGGARTPRAVARARAAPPRARTPPAAPATARPRSRVGLFDQRADPRIDRRLPPRADAARQEAAQLVGAVAEHPGGQLLGRGRAGQPAQRRFLLDPRVSDPGQPRRPEPPEQ